MLKKALLVGAVAALLTGGVVGIAYAHDEDSANGHNTCAATESTHQENNHARQLLGGNASVDRVMAGVLPGQGDKAPGICPSVNLFND
jgi:uncharacterized membrane protein